jgi:putative transposase
VPRSNGTPLLLALALPRAYAQSMLIGPWVYRKAIRYDVPGHLHFYTFSCYRRLPLLLEDVWCQWLAESIAHARKVLEVELWAYVFMPDHVHLLLRPRREKYRISEFMQLAKNPVARRVISSLKQSHSLLLEDLRLTRRDGVVEYRFWQAGGGYDGNLWNMEKVREKADYCHKNPVRRGRVHAPEMWRLSSFRWLVLGARDGEPVKVDEWAVE